MYIDGDILELDIEMDLEEVKALQAFVKDRLGYIEEISLLRSGTGLPTTSALFSLLFCMKKVKPSLKIDFMNTLSLDLESFGMMYWNTHE
ncbi:hypothetical protein Sdiek1_2552 [Sulfurospirillum diekertiae]|uniref:STAS domain-containing protein n=1 Tax=Sulfurospirillum diekertiae TaxID=1854492 RepID=A0A1Y0HNK6_9BACT|nr:hypothetical protein [Sulfurospirillum diekertiae]ARU49702.1 hypothetical protein Sdiek1_2552 [Sulfurospirillum diekertiae]